MARLLRLPLLVGYLLAGVVLSPHTPGFVAAGESVQPVAELGVTLLMFAVGTHLSLGQLAAARRTALLGGGVQIGGTILLGLALGIALGWGFYGGIFLGSALALSSTAVMMRMLEERGELGTAHGTAMMSILVVQDLAVVVMVVLLPALASISAGGMGALGTVAGSLLQAAASVGIALALAVRGVPALLDRVARTGSQELFLLVVVCVCLAAAYLARLGGLSLELGAFLAGMVVSESDYAHEVFNQVRPLRDVFASLFFVSVGMLLNPIWVMQNWPAVLLVVLAVVVGKGLIAGAAVWLAGAHGRTAVLSGLGLAQIGEFSVVLATIGIRRELIPEEISGVLLSGALVSILLTPFVFGNADRLYHRLNRIPRLSRLLNRPVPEMDAETPLDIQPQVVILGCGRVGRYVSDSLRAMEVPHVVVDYEANAVNRLRKLGVPIVYGDATSEVVLEKARPDEAKLAIVTLPEAAMTGIAVRMLRRLAPRLEIVARVHRGVDIPRVRAAGADAVIHAEFEAGTEMIRQGLDRLGFPDRKVDLYIEGVRQHRYRDESQPPE